MSKYAGAFIAQYGLPRDLSAEARTEVFSEIVLSRIRDCKKMCEERDPGSDLPVETMLHVLWEITQDEIEMFEQLDWDPEGVRTTEAVLIDLEVNGMETLADALLRTNPTLELNWEDYLAFGEEADHCASYHGTADARIYMRSFHRKVQQLLEKFGG